MQLMQASSSVGRYKVNPYRLAYASGKASRTLARFIQIDDSDPDPAVLWAYLGWRQKLTGIPRPLLEALCLTT